MPKIFYAIFGIVNGCFGIAVGVYLVFMKSITISIYFLPLIGFVVLRICPLVMAINLAVKLFPESLEIRSRRLKAFRIVELLSLVSPFWFMNLLRGAEFLVTSYLDVIYEASLRKSMPQKTVHPSILFTIPCDYGYKPSESGCINIDSMLDSQSWNPILDKLYPHLYKPMKFILNDLGQFLQYASEFRSQLKAFRILVGNFSFLNPYSTYVNGIFVADTILVVIFQWCFLAHTSQAKKQKRCSQMLLAIEVIIRFLALLSFIFTNDGFPFLLLAMWTVISMSIPIFSFIIALFNSLLRRVSLKTIAYSVLLVITLGLPLASLSFINNMAEKEMTYWDNLNRLCNGINISSLLVIDVRNIVREIKLLENVTLQFQWFSVNSEQLHTLVQKNEFEYDFVVSLTKHAIYKTWFPLIFVMSLLPFVTMNLISIRKQRPKVLTGRHLFFFQCLNMFTISTSYLVIPMALSLGVYLQSGQLYDINISHDPSKGTDIFVNEVTPSHYDDPLFNTKLLSKSQFWFYKIIQKELSLGGDCAGNGNIWRNTPKDILFMLNSNIVYLRTMMMYKKYRAFYAIPFLLHYHIYYIHA